MTTAPQVVAPERVRRPVGHPQGGRRLLTGHGQYVDDVRCRACCTRRSSAASRARPRSRASTPARPRPLPGVVAVYTWHDFDGTVRRGVARDARARSWPCRRRSRSATCATSATRSRSSSPRAATSPRTPCELVEVEYEPQQAVVDYATAAADTEHLVHAGWGLESNAMVAMPFMPISADLDEAFANAAHVVECTIEQNRYICVPMETRGIIASWTPGRDEMEIVVRDAVGARDPQLLRALSRHPRRQHHRHRARRRRRIRPEDVRVPRGVRHRPRLDAARHAGEVDRGPPREPARRRRTRATSSARCAWRSTTTASSRRSPSSTRPTSAPTRRARRSMDPTLLPGPYKIPRLGFSMSMVWTNTMGKGAYRGPWMFETTAREMAIDYAAREIGLDPAEFRRKNLLAAADLPHTAPGRPGVHRDHAARDARPGARDARLRRVPQGAGGRRAPRAGSSASGSACTWSPRRWAAPRCTPRAPRCASSRAARSWRSSAPRRTARASRPRWRRSSPTRSASATTTSPSCRPTRSRRRTARAPAAAAPRSSPAAPARDATVAVRDKVLQVAAHAMEASPDDLEIADSVVSVRGTPTQVDDVARGRADRVRRTPTRCRPSSTSGLEATVRFRPDRFPTWSNATHACVVEIDPDTWLPAVKRYIVSEDCGNMINPNVVEGQIAGGVVQGLGGVLLEDFVYDADGNPLTSTFMDYLLPTATEVPDLEIGHIDVGVHHEPGRVQGPRRGRRDRLARRGRQRGRRRARPPRRRRHEDAARPEENLRARPRSHSRASLSGPRRSTP